MDMDEFDEVIEECIKMALNATQQDIIRMRKIYDKYVNSNNNLDDNNSELLFIINNEDCNKKG